MKVAIVIGHQEKSKGAVNSTFGMTEFEFNQKLAHDIEHNFGNLFNFDQHEIVVMYRETTLQNLPKEVNEQRPDLVIELHCNAFNKQANGCETLYYHKSIKGKTIAAIFQKHILEILKNKDRGIKPKTAEDRGGYMLRYTNAPCIITEPFFIDNDDELINGELCFNQGGLTAGFCEAIAESLEYLKGLG